VDFKTASPSLPPLVLVASTLITSPCSLESPPLVDIDLQYKCSLFLSFALSGSDPFVAGDIKHSRIGGGVAPGRGAYLNFFLQYTHLLVTRQIAQNIVVICSKWPDISNV